MLSNAYKKTPKILEGVLIYFHILDMHFLFLCFTYNTFERPSNTAIR